MILSSICIESMGKSDTEAWLKHRSGRITSSLFGEICHRRSRQSEENIADEIRRPTKPSFVPKACQYELDYEDEARSAYADYKEVEVKQSGLCVSEEARWIGGSPDGVVFASNSEKPWLLEIKTIYDTEPSPRTIRQVARDRGTTFYCFLEGGEFELSRTHKYFFQIMGLIGILKLDFCDFVV